MDEQLRKRNRWRNRMALNHGTVEDWRTVRSTHVKGPGIVQFGANPAGGEVSPWTDFSELYTENVCGGARKANERMQEKKNMCIHRG